jgi:hypothetical protein
MRKLPMTWLSISFGVLLGASAAANAASSVKLSWAAPTARENGQALAVSDLTGYELYYTSDDPTVSGTVQVSGGTTTTYTVQNLAAGTYHFAMASIDATGMKSKLSTVADITLAAASTAAPNGPSAATATVSSGTVAGRKNITIGWSIPTARVDGTALAVTDLAGYKIKFTSFSSAKVISGSVSSGSINSYVVTNIPAGGLYIVDVAAIDKSGKQSASTHTFVYVQ